MTVPGEAVPPNFLARQARILMIGGLIGIGLAVVGGVFGWGLGGALFVGLFSAVLALFGGAIYGLSLFDRPPG